MKRELIFDCAPDWVRAAVVEDAEEKRRSIRLLMGKYSPDESAAKTQAEIDAYWERLCMVKLNIEHMTGKQGLELTEQQA